MGDEFHHECGVAALYQFQPPRDNKGRECDFDNIMTLMPQMLLDLQNRGQLAAGVTTFNPERPQILDTFKDVGTVNEVFRLSHPGKHQSILDDYAGRAAIGHTRYATSGDEGEDDDDRYAQPFERQHGRLWKWFSLAFNGNLANYVQLRERLLSKRGYHFTLNIDTEIIMHTLAYRLRGERMPDLCKVMASLSRDFDGAYNIAFLDATGRMFVARDPLGFHPMNWAVKDGLFGAASESVALTNLGFTDIRPLEPGQMAVVEKGGYRIEQFAPSKKQTRCFFEWVYFSNVASEIDDLSVYQSRARAGKRLAEFEDQPVDKNCIVVPVPDTAKAAAAFAYHIGVPCMEGVIRNRYVGRTFIQPRVMRGKNAKSKYTSLPSVLGGKRIFLVEDSVVRSLTLQTLAHQLREIGGVAEVHVRVACPPIVAPCFYGIDMSTLDELFAPTYFSARYTGTPTPQTLQKMARTLKIDSLRYLPVPELAPSIGCENDTLCKGCVTSKYPTIWGNKLIRLARKNVKEGTTGRTYG